MQPGRTAPEGSANAPALLLFGAPHSRGLPTIPEDQVPSNETALILSAIDDLREEGRARDEKLDDIRGALPVLAADVARLKTEVGRHRWGGMIGLLLIAAGMFGEPAKTALMKLLGVH